MFFGGSAFYNITKLICLSTKVHNFSLYCLHTPLLSFEIQEHNSDMISDRMKHIRDILLVTVRGPGRAGRAYRWLNAMRRSRETCCLRGTHGPPVGSTLRWERAGTPEEQTPHL